MELSTTAFNNPPIRRSTLPTRPYSAAFSSAAFSTSPTDAYQPSATFSGLKPPKVKGIKEGAKKFANFFRNSFHLLKNTENRQLTGGLFLTYGLPVILTVGAVGTAFTSLLGIPIAGYFGEKMLGKMDQQIKLYEWISDSNNAGKEIPDKFYKTLKQLKLHELSNEEAFKALQAKEMPSAHRLRNLLNEASKKLNKSDNIKDVLNTFNQNIEHFFGDSQNKTFYRLFHLGETSSPKFKKWEMMFKTRAHYMKSWTSFFSKTGRWLTKSRFSVVKAAGIPFVILGNLIFALKHGKTLWKTFRGKAV